MSPGDSEQLKHFVELLHSRRATFVQSVPVREKFRGKLARDGIVHIFAIEDNPDSKRAYAWYSSVEGSEVSRIVAVLHQGRSDRQWTLYEQRSWRSIESETDDLAAYRRSTAYPGQEVAR